MESSSIEGYLRTWSIVGVPEPQTAPKVKEPGEGISLPQSQWLRLGKVDIHD